MLAITRMAIAREISAALGLVVRPTFLPSPLLPACEPVLALGETSAIL